MTVVEVARVGVGSLLAAAAGRALAAPLPVENGSFERPPTTFVTQSAVGWTITVPPETGTAGVFSNDTTAVGAANHFTNQDGTQLAFTSTESGHEFRQPLAGTTFAADTRYVMRVGVAISTFSPAADEALMIALYRTDGGQRLDVASTLVFNDAATGLSTNRLKYFTAEATIDPGDPAVGQPVGIRLAAVGRAGGRYFDFDDVSVSAEPVPEPSTAAAVGLAGGSLLARRRRARR